MFVFINNIIYSLMLFFLKLNEEFKRYYIDKRDEIRPHKWTKSSFYGFQVVKSNYLLQCLRYSYSEGFLDQ